MSTQITQAQIITQLQLLANQPANQPSVTDTAKAAIAIIDQQAKQITDDQALIQKQTALITKLQSAVSPTPPTNPATPPAVKGLIVTPLAGHKLSIDAQQQTGVMYNLATQEDTGKPIVQGPQGITLPATIDSPAAGQVYGLIVTPILNGVAGTPVNALVDFTKVVTPPPAPSQNVGTPFTVRANEAGLPTCFDGTACVPDVSKLQYRWTWNFGDGSAEVEGFTAAHCFEKSDDYTVTLKLQPIDNKGALTGTAPTILRQSATITPSTRKVVNVPDGVDLGQYDGQSGIDLQLAKGGKYTASKTINLTHSAVFLNGATVSLTLAGTVFSTDNCRIDGGTFDWPADAHPKSAVYGVGGAVVRPRGRTAVTNCTFLNVGDAVNCNGQPDGVLVENCTAPLVDGIRGYFVWVQGKFIHIYGNTVANCVENHVVRAEATTINAAVFGNDFSNVGQVVSGVPGDNSKASTEFHQGEYIYIANNKFRGDGSNGDGDLAMKPLGPTPGVNDPGPVTCFMVIGNTVQGYIGTGAGASHGAILANKSVVIDSWFKPSAAIVLNVHDTVHPDLADLIVGGNTTDPKYPVKLRINGPTPVGLVSDWSAA